ncbi:MAG TPA: GTP-binding protein [Nitrospinota bacterium]|nr:GTP-binding protein [Nitrospinota bacterium]|tara:strand:+ start:17436 stop:18053 length:618 start_codon:yes stop_codon:yes gene_type:complete
MRLVQIAGYLGSGKTTFLLALVQKLAENDKKVAILVNDMGEIPVDGKVMEKAGMKVKDIGGGCVCCTLSGSLMNTLLAIGREQNPDFIIIEPTGIAVPKNITELAQRVSKKVEISFGATITLFDTTRAEKLVTYDTLKRLISTQIKDSDIVALSKVDACDADAIKFSKEEVAKMNPNAEIINLSTKEGVGFEELASAVMEIEVSA